MTVTIDDIRTAAERLHGAIVETPCVASRTLSEISGASLWLKLENLQFTASFKERGALNRLLALDDDERRAGVVAMSAGNHAQAVAYHATRLGIPSTIVMPRNTPFIKVRNTEALGATVVLHGDDLEAAAQHAHALADDQKLVYVHPYDDPLIIAGQGTVAIEMLAAVPDLDVLVVPIGGGGLIAGMATAAKAIRPDIEIVGVEAALYPSMRLALEGKPPPPAGLTIAEGIAVKAPGAQTLPVVRDLVADIILASEAEIEYAVHLIAEIEKLVAEGAGAAGLAAVLGARERFAGRRVGLLVSGGNIDSRLLASVLMRGLVREGRLVRLRVELSDVPGSLSDATRLVAEAGANIIEVEHERWFYDVPVRLTEVDFMIEVRDEATAETVIQRLCEAGFPARRLASKAIE